MNMKQHNKSSSNEVFEDYLRAQKHRYEQQDKLLDVALNKVQNIKAIALDMGKELDSHKEILEDNDEQVEKQKHNLKSVNRKIDRLNGESSNTSSSSNNSSGMFSFLKWFW